MMPGDNCAFNQCGTNHRTKGNGLFKLPTAKDDASRKWRQDFLNILTNIELMTKILKGSWLLIRYTFVRNIFSLKRLIFVSQLKFIRRNVILDYTLVRRLHAL